MMGYDAYNLLYGIPGWGFSDKVKYPFLAEQSGKYPVSKDAVQLSGTNEAPKPLGDTVEAAAIAYFPNGFKAIKAADLYANLNDGDKSNDPVIIDVRKAEDYAAGHISGAANVTVGNLFKTDTLAKLPKNKQVVLYCYSGQTASQATAALRMLGYDAYNMQFGMAAWAIVDSTSSPVWEQDKSSGKYTLEVSAAPAVAAAAPKTVPTTGGPLSLAFALSGLSLIGAGLALRKR
jgi:rhodanese-related sulfurtransferase